MRIIKNIMFLMMLLVINTAEAHMNKSKVSIGGNKPTVATYRDGDCAQGTSQIDMDINNVRARLLSSGDVWWDLSQGRYVVPKVEPGSGLREVSALYAGSVWLAGFDEGNNLKAACQTYRNATTNDFWPGPLDPLEGTVSANTCDNWDNHWVVSGDSVRVHLQRYQQFGADYTSDLIPKDVKGWPARGNKFFFDINGFELPNTDQGLANFFDDNGNGLYEPDLGDYPVIDIRYCPNNQYPDQMIFWIYNDNGGIHTSTNADPIRMEVQVQAFAYKTNDELNDMTFQRYKLINRATQAIDSTFFAMWTDPDLGCYTDDYIGCDTTRSLMFVYNEDAFDGTAAGSCACDDDVASYCDKIPVLGVDYFRGPRRPVYDATGLVVLKDYTGLEDSAIELGMSSFTYFNNNINGPIPGTTDPDTKEEYYNLLTGRWKDGTPFTFGGSAYNGQNGTPTNFAFSGDPSNASEWSMCGITGLNSGDRRTLQATGPFRLLPGAINELIVGAIFVPDQGSCPDLTALRSADDKAQQLFDACFDITDGPDAPDVCLVELDREIILLLSNDSSKFITNNPFELYQEKVLGAEETGSDTDSFYFQGYKIFQFSGPDAGINDINNPDKARLVAQVDIADDVTTIYNWDFIKNPVSNENIWVPTAKTLEENKGIQHAFHVTEDRFAKTSKALVNHKKYYFTVIAYAHNNWKQLNTNDGSGQQKPYLEGRRNIGDANVGTIYYTAIPRPITDKQLNAVYGQGVAITRVDGKGVQNNFVDMTDASRDAILAGNFDGTITYKEGQGPINVSIYNPLDVKDGEFELTMVGDTIIGQCSKGLLKNSVHWELRNTVTNKLIKSEKNLSSLNEQLIGEYGFSISIAQVADAGDDPNGTNGAIGSTVEYADPSTPWLAGITDQIGNFRTTDFVRTGNLEADAAFDSKQSLSKISDLFVPYWLGRWDAVDPTPALFTPVWQNTQSQAVRESTCNGLSELNNVDIVLTSDKSKWSRCMVVETSSPYLYSSQNGGLDLGTADGAANMDIRKTPSVGKDDANGDGFPDPDGSIEPATISNGIGGTIPNPKAGELVNGMGWFPGYAIDVETGERLNIYFGEASAISPDFGGKFDNDYASLGRDMMWNPSGQVFLEENEIDQQFIYNQIFGGHHYIYVTRTSYDGCDYLRTRLDTRFGATVFRKVPALSQVTWTCFPLLRQNTKLKSYSEGLIPNDVTIKLRVNNPYRHDKLATGTGENNNYPKYRFKIQGAQANALDAAGVNAQMAAINVVPNPYYGYSAYETSQFTNIVKVTNLPAKCVVTIYTLDGKLIRQYKRDEVPMQKVGVKPTEFKQIIPDLEWDLKNDRGIPIASGVYLIHVDAPGVGVRTLKWFGVNRKFDPQGL